MIGLIQTTSLHVYHQVAGTDHDCAYSVYRHDFLDIVDCRFRFDHCYHEYLIVGMCRILGKVTVCHTRKAITADRTRAAWRVVGRRGDRFCLTGIFDHWNDDTKSAHVQHPVDKALVMVTNADQRGCLLIDETPEGCADRCVGPFAMLPIEYDKVISQRTYTLGLIRRCDYDKRADRGFSCAHLLKRDVFFHIFLS